MLDAGAGVDALEDSRVYGVAESFRSHSLVDWVEKKAAPPMSVTVTAKDHSLPMCSYYVDFGTRPFRFIRIDAILNWN